MDELLTRPYEPSDAPAVAAFVNMIDSHAGGQPWFTAEEVQTSTATLVKDVAADTRLVVAPDGNLVAIGWVFTPPKDGYRLSVMGGVDPAWRGRGIGRDLLGWQLTRAAEIHRTLAPQAAWEVHASALVGDETALALFRRCGLSPIRYWWEMTAPTGPVATASLPADLTVVPYAAEHEKALYETHNETFADHWGFQRLEFDDWLSLGVRSDGFLPELSMIAFDQEEIAGYVLCFDDPNPDRLFVGSVGVGRPWRRRGIAGGLLAAVLAKGADHGRTTASLGVDADSPTGAGSVYQRVGFTVESRSVTYSLALGG